MARPRKPEAERRSRTIGVRVTTAEAAEIAERAGAARMTKGGYMRRRALGQPVREAAVHRLGARERVELHRIGVDLNQIARALTSGASSFLVRAHTPLDKTQACAPSSSHVRSEQSDVSSA